MKKLMERVRNIGCRVPVVVVMVTACTQTSLGHHPHDVINCFAISPNYASDGTIFLASKGSINLFLASRDGETWQSIRSGLRSQRVFDIAFASDWARSGRAYVVGDAGLERTSDRGLTWHRVWSPPKIDGATWFELSIRHLALPAASKDAEEVVYVATAKAVFRIAGNTAAEIELPARKGQILMLGVSPDFHHDRTIAIGTNKGQLHISHDAGRTWMVHETPAPVKAIAFSPHYSRDGAFWLATKGGGVLRSDDHGQTILSASTGIDDPQINDVAVAADGSGMMNVVAATREGGVYLSRDGGKTWTLTALQVEKTFQARGNHYTSVEFSPSYADDATLFCGAHEGMYISRNEGRSWQETQINPTRMGRRVAFSPTFEADQVMFAGGYGQGIHISTDGGSTWRSAFRGFGSRGAYSIAPAPDYATKPLLLVGVGRSIQRSIDGGATWQTIELEHKARRDLQMPRPAPIYSIAYSPQFSTDHTVFAICKAGDLFRSRDAGLTWTSIARVADWVRHVRISPAFDKDSIIYVGGGGFPLYRSDDGGLSFECILSEAIGDFVLPPDFERSGEVYCYSFKRGLLKSNDRGDTFVTHGAGLDGYFVTSLTISTEGNMLAALTLGGGLFRSTDRGDQWERVLPIGSPLDHAVSLGISPNYTRDGTMLVGTFDGFLLSQDHGRSFRSVMNSEIYDDTRDPWFRRGEEWRRRGAPRAFNRGVSIARRKGHAMGMRFHGVGFSLYGLVGPDFGEAAIYLDGELLRTIDTYAESEEPRLLVEAGWIAADMHTLEVHILGTKRRASGGTAIAIDAIEVMLRDPPEVAFVRTVPTAPNRDSLFRRGFSLTKLLVVIGIIVLLVVLLLARRSTAS